MAEVHKTINASGADYTTPALWEADIPADADVGDPWIGTFTGAITVAVFTWNVSNANNAPHKLTVNDASYHAGQKSTGAMIRDTGGVAITISTPAIIIEKLRLENTRNQPIISISSATATVQRNLFFKNSTTGGGTTDQCRSSGAGTRTFRNNIFTIDIGTPLRQLYCLTSGTNNIYHNAFNNEDGVTSVDYAISATTGATANIYGNILAGTYATAEVQTGGTVNYDYNMTIRGAFAGTNGWDMTGLSIAATDIFTDSVAGDCRIKSTFAAYSYINAGNNVSGTVDVVGNYWIANVQNIGPWQDYPAAPAWTTGVELPSGQVGVAYNQDVDGTGTGTITIAEVGGTLPDGITFADNEDGTGTFAGTPTETVNIEQPLRRQDAWGQYADRTFTAEITGGGQASTGSRALDLDLGFSL